MNGYSGYVDCVNCGRQNLVDGSPGEICLFCGQPVGKKVLVRTSEIINKKEVEVMVTEEERARYKAMSPPAQGRWLKSHLEEIVVDIRAMPRKEVLKKWPFGQTTLLKFIKLHAPELIGKRAKKKEKPETKKTKDQVLTEHEELLMLRGYQQAVQEILKGQ